MTYSWRETGPPRSQRDRKLPVRKNRPKPNSKAHDSNHTFIRERNGKTSQFNALNHTHNEYPRPITQGIQLNFFHRRLLLLNNRRQRKRLRLLRRPPSQRANMGLHVPMERQRDVLAGRNLVGDVMDLVFRRLVLEVQLRLS